jgi:hypothetical protein
VKTLWQGTQAAGNYELEFDAENLPAGVYFGRLTTSTGIFTQRMVVMK